MSPRKWIFLLLPFSRELFTATKVINQTDPANVSLTALKARAPWAVNSTSLKKIIFPETFLRNFMVYLTRQRAAQESCTSHDSSESHHQILLSAAVLRLTHLTSIVYNLYASSLNWASTLTEACTYSTNNNYSRQQQLAHVAKATDLNIALLFQKNLLCVCHRQQKSSFLCMWLLHLHFILRRWLYVFFSVCCICVDTLPLHL